MRTYLNGFLSTVIVAAGLAAIPLAAMVGLLILGTEPNPRHPPADVMGAAVGWGIIAALVGALGAIIGELAMMGGGNASGAHRGLILGGAAGLAVAIGLGISLAVYEMNTVNGQAITSETLGVLAGATVAVLAAIGGIAVGATLRRVVAAVI